MMMFHVPHAIAQSSTDLAEQERRALSELRALFGSQERFVRVHAAESLIEFGESTDAYKIFLEEWNSHRDTPGYRVVVMRVLSHASRTQAERQNWINRIRDVFLDKTQPDRLHASECLAKLRYRVPETEVAAFEEATLSDDPSIAVFANWILAVSGHDAHMSALFAYLKHIDPAGRYCAAYALRHLHNESKEVQQQLILLATNEPADTLPRAYALSAAFVLTSVAKLQSTLRERMIETCRRGNKDEVREICAAFAARGSKQDITEMQSLQKHENADIREAAARAIICIARRHGQH
jgi:HEAT repeat protein